MNPSVKKSPPPAILFLLGLLVASSLPAAAPAAAPAEGWISLFDGHSLSGWRASDVPGTFSVRDGELVVKGPRSHLYYVGEVAGHDFRNFELSLEVKTFPGSNSGVYFHTVWQPEDWPQTGYEVQVNNSHGDPSRTGGLWGIQPNFKAPAADGQWFTLTIRVTGKRIVTRVDGKLIADYTEEPQPVRPAGLEKRLISSGTIALQGHDPDSEVHYRNIRVRLLP